MTVEPCFRIVINEQQNNILDPCNNEVLSCSQSSLDAYRSNVSAATTKFTVFVSFKNYITQTSMAK